MMVPALALPVGYIRHTQTSPLVRESIVPSTKLKGKASKVKGQRGERRVESSFETKNSTSTETTTARECLKVHISLYPFFEQTKPWTTLLLHLPIRSRLRIPAQSWSPSEVRRDLLQSDA